MTTSDVLEASKGVAPPRSAFLRAFKSLPKWKRLILFKVACATVDGEQVRVVGGMTSTLEITSRSRFPLVEQ